MHRHRENVCELNGYFVFFQKFEISRWCELEIKFLKKKRKKNDDVENNYFQIVNCNICGKNCVFREFKVHLLAYIICFSAFQIVNMPRTAKRDKKRTSHRFSVLQCW